MSKDKIVDGIKDLLIEYDKGLITRPEFIMEVYFLIRDVKIEELAPR